MREISYFLLAYHGEMYHGFQFQPGLETVEGCVLSALKEISCFDELSRSTYSHGGRTDRGVSAIGQIISLSLPENCNEGRVAEAVEGKCRGVYVWGYRESLPPQFKIRYWALWRDYVYFDRKNRYLSQPNELRKVANLILSMRDLSVFYKNFKLENFSKYYFYRRLLRIEVMEAGDILLLNVRGGSFPYHFVRRLVSFLRKYESSISFQENIERWPGGEAEAENLILMRVMTNYSHRRLLSLKEVSEKIIFSLPFWSSSSPPLELSELLSLAWDP